MTYKKKKKRQFASCHKSYQTCLGWLLQLWLNGNYFLVFFLKKNTIWKKPLPWIFGLTWITFYSLFFVPCGVLLRNAYSWRMKVTLYFSRTSMVKLFLKRSPGTRRKKRKKKLDTCLWILDDLWCIFVIHAFCSSQYTLIWSIAPAPFPTVNVWGKKATTQAKSYLTEASMQSPDSYTHTHWKSFILTWVCKSTFFCMNNRLLRSQPRGGGNSSKWTTSLGERGGKKKLSERKRK